MSSEEHTAVCATHGKRRSAHVCAHTVKSLHDSHARGFQWVRDESGGINAYCNECDATLERGGGEWNAKSEAFADVKLVCEECAKRAAIINGIEELSS